MYTYGCIHMAVYIWLIRFAVQQKLRKKCKMIINYFKKWFDKKGSEMPEIMKSAKLTNSKLVHQN